MWCPSVRLSVCPSAKMSNHIFNIFLPSGSHSSCSVPNVRALFRREPPPPMGSVECRWGRQKSRFPTWLHRMLSTLRPPSVIHTYGAAGPWQVVTLIAGSKRLSFFDVLFVFQLFALFLLVDLITFFTYSYSYFRYFIYCSAAEYCAPVWSRSAQSHKSGRCAVELYHASHLWYPPFYTSLMASSALQH